MIKQYLQASSPNRRHVDTIMQSCFGEKEELSVVGPHIIIGERLVLLGALQHELLSLAHEGHHGMMKTKQMLHQYY